MRMKKGIFTLALIILTGLLFLGIGALIAADLPEEIAISSEGYKADKKGPVNLSHKKHAVEYRPHATNATMSTRTVKMYGPRLIRSRNAVNAITH